MLREDRRRERKVERGVTALDGEVAGQPADRQPHHHEQADTSR